MIRSPIAILAWSLATVAAAAEYPLPESGEIVGETLIVEAREEDTFVILARRHDVGFEALRQANPDVDPWLPGEGTQVVIPTQFVLPRAERRGIVVNVPELRLYYFPDDGSNRVITHPISIGRMDWGTPLGRTTIVAKAEKPSWYPPQSIRDEHAAMNDPLPAVVPPGPDNPLGDHALRLGIPGYLIHGTNKPAGLGMRVTHGCIRMFPEDIEGLFSMVPTGTPVHIVNQPYKLGWGDDGLYIEAHPPLDEEQQDERWTATELTRIFVAATQEQRADVRWRYAEEIMAAGRGTPALVSVPGTITAVLAEETDVAGAALTGESGLGGDTVLAEEGAIPSE